MPGRRGGQMRFLVTAGPTRESIDPVRFVSNRSSGRMGYCVAADAARRGHRVTLVSGPVELDPPDGVTTVRVESAREMRDAVMARIARSDCLVMTAAVADYRPARYSPVKLRRRAAERTIRMVRNPDILAEARAADGERVIVGFALEDDLEGGRRKLATKGVDVLVVNTVAAMGAATSDMLILGTDGGERSLRGATKRRSAGAIVTVARRLARERGIIR